MELIDFLEYAIKYGKLGWKVFPVNLKIPSLKGWQEAATSDPEELKELFKLPHTGIGLATGKASGVTVLDVDVKNGCNGFQTLKNTGHELPVTVTSTTPNEGKHFFFKYTNKLGNMVSILGKKSGLDIRNDGGYVVLPPSKTSEGKKYEFLEEQDPWSISWN